MNKVWKKFGNNLENRLRFVFVNVKKKKVGKSCGKRREKNGDFLEKSVKSVNKSRETFFFLENMLKKLGEKYGKRVEMSTAGRTF